MFKKFNLILSLIYLSANQISCYSSDGELGDYDYDPFDFLPDHELDKSINFVDSQLLDVTQQIDDLVQRIDFNTIQPFDSSFQQTPLSSVGFWPNFMQPENNSEFRKRMINKIEKQIKNNLNLYKFNKANRLTCLRRHLLVEHDRLNELERIKDYKNLELIQRSLIDHISWFSNYSENLLNKENRDLDDEYIDGNGIVDILLYAVNRKIIFPNQPYKIKKNAANLVYSLKPFVILDAQIESKNSTKKVSLLRSSQFYLKNNVNNKFYTLKGNLSLALVMNMKNQFELFYNYVFDTSIDTNLIGTVEINYFYEQFKFDISLIEILDFQYFNIKNNFNFFQGLIINPVLNTVKGRIMEVIRFEANKFLKKLVLPLKMKDIFDVIK